MNETSSEGGHPVDREGLHEILGRGGFAVRIVNLLVRNGVATPSDLRRTTYNELLDISGIGEKAQARIVMSLEYADRRKREGR